MMALTDTQIAILPWRNISRSKSAISAFYVEGYLSFCLPAILTGLVVPLAGLQLAADVYGAVVILLALGSLLAMLWVMYGRVRRETGKR